MNHNRNGWNVYQYNTIYIQFYSRTQYYNNNINNHVYIFRNLKQKVHTYNSKQVSGFLRVHRITPLIKLTALSNVLNNRGNR